MFEVLVLAAAASLGAAEFDFEDLSFWSRSYSIPSYYRAHRIEVEVAEIPPLLKATSPCRYQVAYDEKAMVAGVCRLPESKAEAMLATLREGGRLIHYWQVKWPRPAMAEVRYKHDHLLAEREILRGSNSIPGILSLVEEQVRGMAALLAGDDFASLVRLDIVMATPEAVAEGRQNVVMPVNDFPKERSAEIDLSRYPWRRGRYAACEQIPRLSVEIVAVPGSDAAKRARQALWTLGEDYSDPKCAPSGSEDGFAVLSRKKLGVLRASVSRLEGFRAMQYSAGTRPAHEIRDGDRLRILTSELRAAEQLLRQAPHIRALVAAEIHGVRAPAEEIERLRGATLIVARLVLR